MEGTFLYGALPEGSVGTQTTLYHQNETKADTSKNTYAELLAEAGDVEPMKKNLDNLMMKGLEVTYPKQLGEKNNVPSVTQKDHPSQNTRARNN